MKISINRCNGWIIFSIVVFIYLLFSVIIDQYIFGKEVYIRSFSDQLTQESLEAMLGFQERYWWFGYVFTPLLLLIKLSFATVCISIGTVLSNVEFHFKNIFKVVLLAEVVFIVAQTLYLVNLSFHLDTLTLETASNYYPLTILSYFGTENVVQWLQYPLQTLNLFEVAYIVVISWLLSKQWKEDFAESMLVVLPSYATGLILWLVFVAFITLQVS
ncbi:hypothetical protein CK503_13695 [Aliifodinibius salipaludis]|uniref:Yip1 domain-containing protein n=1 Tax=Fodinibius salipaludis TaxID=2032627 RepID=A0A2A2G802_9BACT|nr:hypothetical protein CK503_13695 [Aliifodinibius salipaludis]